MVQLKKICLALILFLWLLSACTPSPEVAATIAVARPTIVATPSIENIIEQPTPLSTPIPPATGPAAGPTATATASPLPTPISTEDVQATATAYQATDEAEVATLFAPTATFTPSPTFTPIPGPVWSILFRAVPCAEGISVCEDILFQGQHSVEYLINSDGSALAPVTELGLPPNIHVVISPDGTQIAYLNEQWHLFLANADGSEAIDLGAGDFGVFYDFQFISEVDCLYVARFVSWADEGGANFVIEKWCKGQLQPQELEVVTFPVFYQIRFSPQADALLAFGRDLDMQGHLLVHEIGGNTQLLFSSTDQYLTGPAHWLPDGEKIEFITASTAPNVLNTITTTFHLIDRNKRNLEVRLSVTAGFEITSGIWSPNGQEFAFTYGGASANESGIYILDLNSGEWRQILSHFYLGSLPVIDVWPQNADEASE